MPRICVFTGQGACQNTNPVLCSDAASSIGSASSISNPVGTTFAPRNMQPAMPIMISTHMAPPEMGDMRPRIYARLDGDESGIAHSLLFATADLSSWLQSGSGGYVFNGRTPQVPGPNSLTFRSQMHQNSVNINRSVSERIRIFSSCTSVVADFVHDSVVHTTGNMQFTSVGEGVLAASRTSPFAQAAGIFLYQWPDVLLIGERDQTRLEERFCARGRRLSYFPTKPDVSENHWVLDGEVSISGGTTMSVDWVVDTGIFEYTVPQAIYDSIIAYAEERGAVVYNPPTPVFPQRLLNCGDVASVFPAIDFKVGMGPAAVHLTLQPQNYIVGPYYDGSCSLRLEPGDMDSTTRLSLLSVRQFAPFAVVFDREEDRIGFCESSTRVVF